MNLFEKLFWHIFFISVPGGYGKITYNTLPSGISRVTEYIPKVIKKMCYLTPDEGPCRADIPMYYFNPATKNCSETFKWGGCQGNGNRFDTQKECMNTCLSQQGSRPSRPTYCDLKFDYGFCFGEDKRWYYDKKWGVCRETIYSGCGGNKNNFYSAERCEDVCRFGRVEGIGTTADSHKIIIMNPLDATTRRPRKTTRR